MKKYTRLALAAFVLTAINTAVRAEVEKKDQTVIVRTGRIAGDAKVVDGKTADGQHLIELKLVGDPAVEGADGIMLVTADVDPQVNHQFKVVQRLSSEADPNRAWLGVMISNVTEPLAEHLAIGGQGVMITNIVEESPAAAAGLQVHDIILSIGGESVEGDVGRLVEILGTHTPGEAVALNVFRAGQEQAIDVVLGTRPGEAGMTWAVALEPMADIEENVHTRGRVMIKDGAGNWQVKDLGDLEIVGDLKGVLPEMGSKSIQLNLGNGHKSMTISESTDGASLSVSREGEGPIVVTRTDANGEVTTDSYDTPEALEAADADAFELYNNTQSATVLHLGLMGDDAAGGAHSFAWHSAGDPSDHIKMLHDHLQFDPKQFEGLIQNLELSPDGNVTQFFIPEGGAHGMHFVPGDPNGFFSFEVAKAKYTFTVNPDGSIDAVLRKGEGEVIRKFTSEADLQQRDPELYGEYANLVPDKE